MRVATSPEWLESCANHPKVRPYIGGDGKSEFRAGESWASTIGLEWDEGGIVFLCESPGIYSVHLVFRPKTKDAAGKLRRALTHMFSNTDCQKVIGATPTRYRHVRATALRAGLRHIKDEGGISHYALTVSEWTQGE